LNAEMVDFRGELNSYIKTIYRSLYLLAQEGYPLRRFSETQAASTLGATPSE